MKKLIFILPLIAMLVASCNYSSSYKTQEENVQEENVQEEPHPTVKRTIEGITLGMTEDELTNIITINNWGNEPNSYRKPEKETYDKRITKYNRNKNQDNLTIQRIVCFNGKVVQIILYIENFKYAEEILNNLKEIYPLKQESVSSTASSVFNIGDTYSYSDGITTILYTPNFRYGWNDGDPKPRIIYTDDEYTKTIAQEKEQKEQSKLNQINENSRNL